MNKTLIVPVISIFLATFLLYMGTKNQYLAGSLLLSLSTISDRLINIADAIRAKKE